MSVFFVQAYVVSHLLLVGALGLVVAVRGWSARSARPISFRQQLHFAYALIVTALIAPWFAMGSPGADFLPKTAQVWSAPSMSAAAAPADRDHHAAISFDGESAGLSLDAVSRATLLLCLVGLVVAIGRLGAGAISTVRLIRRAPIIRQAGALRVLVSDEIDVPFSFWMPGSSHIVVPASLILRADDLRIAVRHEGQHHRQGDTRLLYLVPLLRGLFWLNPAVHWLSRRVRELQEFACDEAVAGRPRSATDAYCDTLLRVAEGAIDTRAAGVCVRMSGERGDDATLLERVSAILRRPPEYVSKSAVIALNTLAIGALLATGIVLPSTVQDRRITLAEAAAMAKSARQNTSFPIVVNDAVVKELNRLLGTPDGRAFVRAGLARMAEHESLITRKLDRYGLPTELLAVPIVESGYRNLPESANPVRGAGIWQFIPRTAREFGLVVDEQRDDRLDLRLETEAAARYFSRLHTEFGSWPLALLAYNSGSANVQRGIHATGSRDAFRLTASGYENDPDYLPRAMAAIIAMKNSHLL